jgi:hypothetical protein
LDTKPARVIFRGFIRGVKQFEEEVHVDLDGDEVETIAERHGRTLLALPGRGKHMLEIEFEFPDEPDPLQRFFRIGWNVSGRHG